MHALCEPHCRPTVYGQYLARQWRLHAALEPALRGWLTPEWAETRLVKADWLAGDLRALGSATTTSDLNPPAIESMGAALGTLYVLEGALLGVQVVRKRLPPGHPGAGPAGRFLQGYGARSSDHWREFLAHLETLPHPDWSLALGAAADTFGLFHHLFLEPLHE